MLFQECKQHSAMLTHEHLLKEHEINLPKLDDVVALGSSIEKKIKSKEAKRKGRIFRMVEVILSNHCDMYKIVCNCLT